MLTEDLPEDKKLRQEIHLKKLVRTMNWNISTLALSIPGESVIESPWFTHGLFWLMSPLASGLCNKLCVLLKYFKIMMFSRRKYYKYRQKRGNVNINKGVCSVHSSLEGVNYSNTC